MPSARVAVWLDAHQADFVRAVARQAGVTIAAAGSPSRGQTGAVAAAVECAPLDDLRSAMTEGDFDVIWLAANGDFGVIGDAQDEHTSELQSLRHLVCRL